MADFNEAREREAFEEWRLHYWRNVRGFGGRLTVEEHREWLRTSLSRDEVWAAWQASAARGVSAPNLSAPDQSTVLGEADRDAAHSVPVEHSWFSKAALDVTAERRRQIEKEGWTPDHDDEHTGGEMGRAAACYAYPELTAVVGLRSWPWDDEWFKPRDQRSNLVRAGALILAEIERLDRAATEQQHEQ